MRQAAPHIDNVFVFPLIFFGEELLELEHLGHFVANGLLALNGLSRKRYVHHSGIYVAEVMQFWFTNGGVHIGCGIEDWNMTLVPIGEKNQTWTLRFLEEVFPHTNKVAPSD